MSKAIHPLRKWRKSQPSPTNPAKSMSQAELGDLVGVGSAQISLIESWDRGCSYSVAKKIVDLAGDAVSLETLITKEASAA